MHCPDRPLPKLNGALKVLKRGCTEPVIHSRKVATSFHCHFGGNIYNKYNVTSDFGERETKVGWSCGRLQTGSQNKHWLNLVPKPLGFRVCGSDFGHSTATTLSDL
jgi:hypothetical protein